MKRISLLSFLILFAIYPTLNTLAQDGAPAPTMLTLEVTFYPGRKPVTKPFPDRMQNLVVRGSVYLHG